MKNQDRKASFCHDLHKTNLQAMVGRNLGWHQCTFKNPRPIIHKGVEHMPVIGFAFNAMEGKREKVQPSGEIKVNSTPKVTDVKEITLPNFKEKALAISWEFATTYEPNIGTLKITGELLYLAKGNKPVLAEWRKRKALPDQESVEVLNHLFRRCLLKASNIAEDLQLPPPLNFPIVKKKD